MISSPSPLETLRRAARARASSWLWVLVWALVLPSLWGTWHRVAHAPGLHTAAQTTLDAVGHEGHGSGTAECRLLDQAACAESPGWALAGVPLVLASPPRQASVLWQDAAARLLADYCARAPPIHPWVESF